MTALTAQEIYNEISTRKIIQPCNLSIEHNHQFQAASYDIRTGYMIHVDTNSTASDAYRLLNAGDEVLICPSSVSMLYEMFINKIFPKRNPCIKVFTTSLTIKSYENLAIPNDIASNVVLRTSAVRAGLIHSLAGWIDPGFVGNLSLTLSSTKPVKVYPLMRIAQLIFYRLSEETVLPYGSNRNHYQNQSNPLPVADNVFD